MKTITTPRVQCRDLPQEYRRQHIGLFYDQHLVDRGEPHMQDNDFIIFMLYRNNMAIRNVVSRVGIIFQNL